MNTENIEEIADADESEEITVNVEETETEIDTDELEESEDEGVVYKTYKLQDETVWLYIERPDERNVGALSNADLVTLAEQAIAQWSYRGGSKKANNGKRYRLTDVVREIRTKVVKVGKPNKDDKADALEFMKITYNGAKLSELAGDAIQTYCLERFNTVLKRTQAKYSFRYNGAVSWNKETLEAFFRQLRLAKARHAKLAKDY